MSGEAGAGPAATNPATTHPTGSAALLADRLVTGFLLAQAAVGVLWWVSLTASDTVRSWFELDPSRPEVLDSLVVADVVVIIVGSLLGARGVWKGAAWAMPVVVFVAGGLVYVTLYLMAWVAFTGEGALCFVVMVPPSTLTSYAALLLWRSRRAVPSGPGR